MKKVVVKYTFKQQSNKIGLWIYDNEINLVDENTKPADIVHVFSSDNKFVGQGYFNPTSKIAVRLLSFEIDEIINADFFKRRMSQCWQYRQQIGLTENCRLVFAEGDFLPGLIIDKFNDYLVIQIYTLGMEIWQDAIIDILNEMFNPKGIYLRNDLPVRVLEGMTEEKKSVGAEFNTQIIINEHGLQFNVDLALGQKTGYFLDQHLNRAAILPFVKDAEILSAFCYIGSFELLAASYGAKSVLGIDDSLWAVEQARANAELNGLQHKCSFIKENAFNYLKKLSLEKTRFDVVMLDPPSFSKSRQRIQQAIAGYNEINLRALKIIKSGGYLISSSCTNLIEEELFLDILFNAAKDAKRLVQQVYFNSQSLDHPILLNMTQTKYLKFIVLRVF